METYCENENSNVRKTKQNRLMLLSSYAVWGKKKLTFAENKEIKVKMNKIKKLKWIKSLTNFYWLTTHLCQNCI